jgi:hypothetical protein
MTMKVHARGRAQGKTVQMIEWLKESKSRVLWVMSQREKDRILLTYFDDVDKEEFNDYNRRIIVSPADLRGQHQKVVGVDNLDLILRNMVGPNLIGPCTITSGEL